MQTLCGILLLLVISLASTTLTAQVTTATLSGKVSSDADAKTLSGATVQITFADAGIKKTIATTTDGSFVVPNLRVGGPYVVTVTFTGYKEKKEENIFLELGQNTAIEFKLESSSSTLTNVVISGKSKVFDHQRTGASTNISSRQLRSLPTISRSADDFTRLTPSASSTYNGTSFAGPRNSPGRRSTATAGAGNRRRPRSASCTPTRTLRRS